MKFFEEINLSDFKSSKIEKEALKEKLFELRFIKLSDEDLDKILEEIKLMKDGAVSIIFLKKMIYSGTKEKFQRIVKREGRDSNDYNRKKRPYSAQEKNRYANMINKILKDDPDCGSRILIDEIKKNEDKNMILKVLKK